MTTIATTTTIKASSITRSLATSLVLILFCLFFIQCHHRQSSVEAAAVIGIDLGTEWIKVGMVKSGSPIDLVLNEQSKRKTAAMIGFRGKDRYFGESARSMTTRFPDKMLKNLNLLIGKSYDQSAEAVRQQFQDFKIPIEFVKNEERGTIDIQVKSEDKNAAPSIYSVEELFAMIFKYIKQLASDSAKAPVYDCVITVPPFYTIEQRQAIYDAASIAQLRILSLMHETTAIALQYGLTNSKTLKDESERVVVFYDMGAASTKVALVTYSNKTTKASEYIGTFTVNGTKWDQNLGGSLFEARLAQKFVDYWKQKFGTDLAKVPRAMARLTEAAKKTKEVLSANTDTVAMVESLHDEKDFVMSVTRAEFDELCADLINRAAAPLDALLKQVGIRRDQVYAFELLGGGSRVPAVQASLKKFLWGRDLGYSLNADEAISLGSAFHGAFISPAFRVKSYAFKDTLPYSLDFKLSQPSTSDVESKVLNLYGKNDELGSKKSINVPREEDFSITVKYSDDSAPVGYSAQSSLLSEYDVIGVNKVMSNWTFEDDRGKNKKVRVTFELNNSGILKLDSATAILEQTVTVRVESKKNTTANATATEEGKGENTEEVKPQYKKEKKVSKVELETKVKVLSVVQPLTDAQKLSITRKMTELEEYEKLKKDISGARNTLESTLYEYRYQLLEDETYKPFYVESEANALIQKIDETDLWMSENDDESIISREREIAYRDQLKGLTDLSQPILDRYNQVQLRAKAIAKCRDEINNTMTYISVFKTISTHITDQEWSDLSELAKETEAWVNATIAKQNTTPLNQAPVALDSDFHSKCSALKARRTLLINKPRPQIDLEKMLNETRQKYERENNTTESSDSTAEESKPATGEEVPPKDEL